MTFPAPEIIDLGDIHLGVYRAGPECQSSEKPAVILMHGWPEMAYSWRHQIAALAESGYPVFAPDMRGYGVSGKPEGVEAYTMGKLTGDMQAMLDHYGIEKAVFIGHDWGAIILWAMPFYMPDRLIGLGGLNVAFMPRNPQFDPIAIMCHVLGENMYIVQFQQEGRCEPQLEADVARTFRYMMRKPATAKSDKPAVGKVRPDLDILAMMGEDEANWPGVPICDPAELQPYVDAFSKGGFTAPLHWYRNFTSNWHAMAQYQPPGELLKIDLPTLMVTAERDVACPARLADGMEDIFTNYTRIDLQGCGHWSMQEQPEQVNAALLNWLNDAF